MKLLFFSLLFLLSVNLFAQQKHPDCNLNFEKIDNKTKLPLHWIDRWNKEGYTLNVDSSVKSNGKYSIRIESKDKKNKESFGCIMQPIPVNFNGRSVTLKGKLKLEDIKEGSAGLLLRIDGKDNMLQFDNMLQRRISGTSDWQEYSTTLPLDDASAKYIYIAVITDGVGKLWADDLSLTIDGVNITEVNTFPLRTYKGESDTSFDKGSNVSITETNERITENLYQLGKIWGFLKYYHPKVTNGDYNWDYELFRVMPKVINAADNSERNKIFLEWINSLGPITEFNNVSFTELQDVKIYPDLEWIRDEKTFSSDLIAKLEEVKNAKRTDTSYYINMYEGVGNPKFQNENSYSDIALDDGHRLVALFRYWNMVQYFFPDKHLIGEDWNTVLKESIPEFINGKTDYDYHLNVVKLIARIKDSHAMILSWDKYIQNYFGENMAPYKITFIEEKPIVTGYMEWGANNFKMKTEGSLIFGDEILSINGKPVQDIIKEKLAYTPGSNYSVQLRDMAYSLLRTNDSVLVIEYNRDGAAQTANIVCNNYMSFDFMKSYNEEKSKKMWKILDNNIGYIYPGVMKNDSLPNIMDKLKDTKGIVIDFRCYPSDFMVFTLMKYLNPLPAPFVKFTMGNIQYPGVFSNGVTLSTGDTNANYYKGKIIILVNETTQSSAEYHTMAFRTAPNSKIIGSTTAGADGNVSNITLPGGIKTMISGIGILTPDGKETQRIGIVPDIEIKQTIKGFREGRDELLEKAIELINN
ncbi:MAG: peptidase S41 [Bacteroidetes bacterium]|nr:peptidase S41 [Bacteroidota bacterium]